MNEESVAISKLMKNPIGIQTEKKIMDALEEILSRKIGRIIIYNSEQPVGIVSEKDILSYFFNDKLHKNIRNVPITEIMNEIYYVDPRTTPFEAAKFMLDRKCSSVCVGSQENFGGIVTKTDLTNYYAENLAGKNKVVDWMSIHYFSVFANDSLYEVMKTMLGFGISRMMIVSNEKQPLGVVSTGDLFKEIINIDSINKMKKSQEMEEFWSKYGIFCSEPAEKVMTESIIKVKADDDLVVACKIILNEKINAVGVEDTDGSLGGIISKRDVLLALSKMN